ncbi:Sjoegren syndrome nuclear autoantigen 1 homolog [Aethina tumida]|uniref:Sjoegren syndrome nuclear autoantigen 1 homolog n=1 Tax=Aethina tumida TaxID=116153 RepID=UPI00096B2EE2|nr:Sjoegren syndrome nuclear autoantigen 1 homolog [Aethina tumida]
MCDLERDCYQQNTCDLGRELLEWNDIILNHLTQLKEQREELDFIIKKQQDELERLKQELEEKTKLSARFGENSKGMLESLEIFDKVIKMLEEGYGNLVETSEGVANLITDEINQLEQIMDKKTSTDESQKKKAVCDCVTDMRGEICQKDNKVITDPVARIKAKRQGCCQKPECPAIASRQKEK